MEFAGFNGRINHEIVIGDDMEKEGTTFKCETVSIKYGRGRRLTVCFIPFKDGDGTIDIMRHDDDVMFPSDNDRDVSFFPFIAFGTKLNEKGEVQMGRHDIRGNAVILTLPYDL